MSDKKQEVCKQVEKMLGYNLVGLSDILSILTHPDVLDLVEELIEEAKKEIL